MVIRLITFFCLMSLLIIFCYAESEEQPCSRMILDVNIDPNQPETIYSRVYDIPANKYVIYKSLDAGVSWHSKSSVKLAFSDLLIHPKDSLTLYLSTGSPDYLGEKSTDGGNTWNRIQTGPKVVNPHNTAILYANGNTGIRKSSNGGDSWIDIKGNWKHCGAITLDSLNPQVLYAYCEGGASTGIFKSINAGEDWKIVLPMTGIFNLVVDPNNSEIVYAGTLYRGVYRSIDGGKQWNTVNNGLPQGLPFPPWDRELNNLTESGTPIYKIINNLVINPGKSNILYVATSSGIFKSIDYGISWQGINKGLPTSSVRVLALNPKDSDIIYIGTEFSGIFKSIDGGETWISSSNGIACGPTVILQ